MRAQPAAGRCCTQLHSPSAGQTQCSPPKHELLTMLSLLSRACSLVAHAPAMLRPHNPAVAVAAAAAAAVAAATVGAQVPLSARGWEQAVACGNSLRGMMEAEHGPAYKLFFMTSPYCRTRQTFVGIRQAFPDANFAGVQVCVGASGWDEPRVPRCCVAPCAASKQSVLVLPRWLGLVSMYCAGCSYCYSVAEGVQSV